MKNILLLLICIVLTTPLYSQYQCQHIESPITTDGLPNESIWYSQDWKTIDTLWIGYYLTIGDFSGLYKVLWDSSKLYFLIKTMDDVVVDTHSDPLDNYPNDDCIEIFIDEDNSGGLHQTSHNAFAYHISLKCDVVDIGTDGKAHLYDDVIEGAMLQIGDTCYWEIGMYIYNDTYVDESDSNVPEVLYPGKVIGFSIAYNDADLQGVRETMTGSNDINDPNYLYDKNINWITADNFDSLVLIAPVINDEIASKGYLKNFSVFPNPANATIKISNTEVVDPFSVSLINMSGQEVLIKDNCISGEIVQTNNIDNGTYILIIKEQNMITYRHELVIEH